MDLMQRRRELLMMGGGGYIKNGLVFQLDGIYKGTSDTTKWVDLIGGMVFTEAGGTSVHEDGCIHVTTTQRLVGDFMPDWPYTTYTIEAAFSPVPGWGWAPIFLMKHGNVAVYRNVDRQIIGGNRGAYKASFNIKPQVVGFAYDRIVVDGELKEAIPNAWNGWDNNLPVINSGSTSQQQYSKDFRLYAVRVYDRLLTVEEMLHNQKVDNERFNLGLQI